MPCCRLTAAASCVLGDLHAFCDSSAFPGAAGSGKIAEDWGLAEEMAPNMTPFLPLSPDLPPNGVPLEPAAGIRGGAAGAVRRLCQARPAGHSRTQTDPLPDRGLTIHSVRRWSE